MRYIALDPGFGGFKAAEVKPDGTFAEASIPSGVGVGLSRRSRRNRPMTIRFDGSEYLVGQHVSDYARPVERLDFNRLADTPELRAPAYTTLYQVVIVVEKNRAAFEAAQAFAHADPLGWLTLMGECGNGKTHLAAAIATTLLEWGMPAVLQTVPAFPDYLRATFAPDSDVTFDDRFEAIKTARALVLDDLGAETATAICRPPRQTLLHPSFR